MEVSVKKIKKENVILSKAKDLFLLKQILRSSHSLRMTALLLLFILLFSNNALAGKNLEIRELDADFLDITEINQAKDSIYKSEEVQKLRKESDIINAPVLKGGVSELKAIVGKYRIFKFDEPLRKFSITNPDLIEMSFLSPKEILVNGIEAGETTVIIWGKEEEPIFFNLFVEKSNYNFIKEVNKIAPNENIKIDFVDKGGGDGLKVVLSGKVSSTITMEKIDKIASAYGYTLVDLTEAMTPQVLLEVKIVEMTKNDNKSNSFEFKQGLFDYLDLGETLAGTQATLLLNGQEFDEPWYRDVAWKSLAKSATDILKAGADDDGNSLYFDVARHDNKGKLQGNSFSNGKLNIWRMYPDKNLSYQINRAQDEGIVKVVAEPRLMVVHGEEATFKSGGKIAIPSGTDQLGNLIVNYEEVGIELIITPLILEETDRIFLSIKTEISEVGASGFGNAPTISSRSGTTKVEVANNQTTVITGLVRQAESKSITKFPFLSNLPVIGKLFDSTTSSKDETEVMVFVTPTIIKPDLARED